MNQVLAGVRVLEVEAIGPVPWAGMILADLGATVGSYCQARTS